MAFLVVQTLTGLASASSLFLVASGLSIIFGVTRVVNFAHGSLFMLGAYAALTLEPAIGFWPAVLAAPVAVAAFGAGVEMLVLRRVYGAPELFSLLATFGLVLIIRDGVILLWGPADRLGPRAPGLQESLPLLGSNVPAYDLFLIALGPLVLGAVWALFRFTRFGILVRAATQDRGMVAACGVDERWLFTGVFALGAFLAGLGGALQMPRETIHPDLATQVVVLAFVITIVGGMGSVTGAYLAAVLIGVLNAVGLAYLPHATLVLPFVVMAVTLVVRPQGLLGERPPAGGTAEHAAPPPLPAWGRPAWVAAGVVLAVAAAVPLWGGGWLQMVVAEIAILALFTAGLQVITGLGGMISFGHAAFFGLGAYGAALAHKYLDVGLAGGLVSGTLLAAAGALAFGPLCVRLSGVYLAMLTLAFAEILHAGATQWYGVTGGDNGILGLWPGGVFAMPWAYALLAVGLVALALLGLRRYAFSPAGQGVRAARDNPRRAEASALPVARLRLAAFLVGGGVSGLAGGLYAWLKGSVFPGVLAVETSVEALVMMLLGGVHSLAGPVLGAAVFKTLEVGLATRTDLWRMVLGGVIVLLVVAAPGGLAGIGNRLRGRGS